MKQITLKWFPVFLIFLCYPCNCSFTPSSNLGEAKSDVSTLQLALSQYYLVNASYPDQNIWEADIKNIIQDGRVPPDPWGNRYVYVYPGKYDPGKYDIYSLGRDGKTESGGMDPDDICTCKMGADGRFKVEEPINYFVSVPVMVLLLCFCYKVAYTLFIKRRDFKNKMIMIILRVLNILSIVIFIGVIFSITVLSYD